VNTTTFLGVVAMTSGDPLTADQLATLGQRSNLQGRQTESIERAKVVCGRLSICRRSLTNLVRRGALKPVRLPGCTRAIGFRRSEVDKLMMTNGGEA